MKTTTTLFSVFLFLAAAAACDGTAGDDSMMLNGSETDALQSPLPDGGTAVTCAAPKVLICHIPPGNPANAHSICVGAPAVAPHQRLHHDTLGACGGTSGGTGGGGGGTGGGAAGGDATDAGDAADGGPAVIL
jgi:hypothetical protein